MAAPSPQLHLDIWLLVFDELDDITFLWSACRNVSHFLRACVDAFFRHGVLQNTLIDLHYSDIHTRHGPVNNYIHVPMVFDRFSDDGTRAVFQQREYNEIDSVSRYKGSVRGWLPFMERYCKETLKPTPKVLHKSKASGAPPLWEREHTHWRNTLSGDRKKSYLTAIRAMTSIGRGDRPPFYIKIHSTVNDTELVDVVVDCSRRELSFNWRRTYSLFFREVDFVARAYNSFGKKRVYDEDLTAVAMRYFFDQNRKNHNVRARQKRLVTWTIGNKHRMSPEVRLWTEHQVESERVRVERFLRRDNLCEVQEGRGSEEEIVPAKLAEDHPDLLFWPWTDEDGFYTPKKKRPRCGPHGCTVL
ncbi:hypothetical protein BU26DRAFT_523147 [Trematosphaeria pertusa]|uniref:Uncharacterized protein n=1 Tax=Trematosphaeria pertusa TaxID=390896 RepID=A0A6A6I4G2_9PLEO|nr:uncharacterized protein BU26DRAFT_523147 [Trematosphaeria pertusa]KAF2244500.1 hypothetical protein BU26DRAFT_523147 [Trematosphaeria pertusa]